MSTQDEAAPEFTLDWPHGHMTRDGKVVEIFCERDGQLYGRRKISATHWMIFERCRSGRVRENEKKNADIINRPAPKPAPFKYVGWGVISPIGAFVPLSSEEEARKKGSETYDTWRVVKVKITEIKE